MGVAPSTAVYNSNSTEFPATNYIGRFKSTISKMDPTYMLLNQKNVDDARKTIANYVPTNDAKVNGEAWLAKRVIDSATHPQTGEMLNPACRMAAFVPLNVPICMGMLFSAPTIFNQVAWQWVNQTYNAAFNFANGNKSSESDNTKIVKSYLAATSISVGLSVGLNQGLKRVKLSPSAFSVASKLVPFVAVASAGFANAVMMRSGELDTGITAFSKTTDAPVGTSKNAASYVLYENVGLSRVALAMPILLMPPVIMGGLRSALPKVTSATTWKIAEIAVLTCCLGLAFPAALSLFEDKVPIPQDRLEKEIAEKAPEGVYAFKGV